MKIKIGDFIEKDFEITNEKIKIFSEISGDNNPIHLDDDYAKNSIFGKRIAHGLFVASFISNLIGNYLPGHGSIYLGQELRFIRPAYVGDTVKVRIKVVDIIEEKNHYILETLVLNINNEEIITGQARIKYKLLGDEL